MVLVVLIIAFLILLDGLCGLLNVVDVADHYPKLRDWMCGSVDIWFRRYNRLVRIYFLIMFPVVYFLLVYFEGGRLAQEVTVSFPNLQDWICGTVPEINRLSQVHSTINDKQCVYILYLPLEVFLPSPGHATKLLFLVELPVCGNLVRASQIPSSSYDCSVESEDLVL